MSLRLSQGLKARQGFYINSPRLRWLPGVRSVLLPSSPNFFPAHRDGKSVGKEKVGECFDPPAVATLQPGAIDIERLWRSLIGRVVTVMSLRRII